MCICIYSKSVFHKKAHNSKIYRSRNALFSALFCVLFLVHRKILMLLHGKAVSMLKTALYVVECCFWVEHYMEWREKKMLLNIKVKYAVGFQLL